MEAILKAIDEMAQRWPSKILTRASIKEFTGGLYGGGCIRNLERLGLAPKSFMVGKHRCYLVKDLVEWLKARVRADQN